MIWTLGLWRQHLYQLSSHLRMVFWVTFRRKEIKQTRDCLVCFVDLLIQSVDKMFYLLFLISLKYFSSLFALRQVWERLMINATVLILVHSAQWTRCRHRQFACVHRACTNKKPSDEIFFKRESKKTRVFQIVEAFKILKVIFL